LLGLETGSRGGEAQCHRFVELMVGGHKSLIAVHHIVPWRVSVAIFSSWLVSPRLAIHGAVDLTALIS
jgi:hypothetical protein